MGTNCWTFVTTCSGPQMTALLSKQGGCEMPSWHITSLLRACTGNRCICLATVSLEANALDSTNCLKWDRWWWWKWSFLSLNSCISNVLSSLNSWRSSLCKHADAVSTVMFENVSLDRFTLEEHRRRNSNHCLKGKWCYEFTVRC